MVDNLVKRECIISNSSCRSVSDGCLVYSHFSLSCATFNMPTKDSAPANPCGKTCLVPLVGHISLTSKQGNIRWDITMCNSSGQSWRILGLSERVYRHSVEIELMSYLNHQEWPWQAIPCSMDEVLRPQKGKD